MGISTCIFSIKTAVSRSLDIHHHTDLNWVAKSVVHTLWHRYIFRLNYQSHNTLLNQWQPWLILPRSASEKHQCLCTKTNRSRCILIEVYPVRSMLCDGSVGQGVCSATVQPQGVDFCLGSSICCVGRCSYTYIDRFRYVVHVRDLPSADAISSLLSMIHHLLVFQLTSCHL